MAEYTNVALQNVLVGGNVNFSESPYPCNKGIVLHRQGSGVFTLRGACNQCFARYKVSFGGNIAIPDGGEVADPVSLAIAVQGEALGSATMIETPAVAAQFNNVFAAVYVAVPKGCCISVSVKNNGTQAVDVQNANIIIERIS